MEPWPTSLIAVAGAALLAYFGYLFGKLSKRDDSIMRFREEKYTTLLVTLQGWVGGSASDELKRTFLQELYKSWLYASDDVVLAINAMMAYAAAQSTQKDVAPDYAAGNKLVSEVILSMRRDLLKKTSLTHSAFRYIDVGADKARPKH